MLILHETKIIKQEQPQKDYNQPKIKLKKISNIIKSTSK